MATHHWRPRLVRNATRAQINEWLDECGRMQRMRDDVRFRCNCDGFDWGCDCDGCVTHMRRMDIHRAINLRAERQASA